MKQSLLAKGEKFQNKEVSYLNSKINFKLSDRRILTDLCLLRSICVQSISEENTKMSIISKILQAANSFLIDATRYFPLILENKNEIRIVPMNKKKKKVTKKQKNQYEDDEETNNNIIYVPAFFDQTLNKAQSLQYAITFLLYCIIQNHQTNILIFEEKLAFMNSKNCLTLLLKELYWIIIV